MALFKPSFTTYTLNGKARTPDGARVTSGTPGAKRKEGKSKTWWGKWTTKDGKVHLEKLHTNKETARTMLAGMIERTTLAAAGVVGGGDGAFAEHYARPLADHLDDFAASLRAENNTEEHVRKTLYRVRRLLAGVEVADLRGVAEIDPDSVVVWLADQRRGGAVAPLPDGVEWFTRPELLALVPVSRNGLPDIIRRHGLPARGHGRSRRYPRQTVAALQQFAASGMSVKTSNDYLGATKEFVGWLWNRRNRRIPENRLSHLKAVEGDEDVVRRRTLTLDEFVRLLAAAKAGPTRFRLTGEQRWVLYQFAARTGLRASEIRSLSPASCDLDDLLVKTRASCTKNSREAFQPLNDDLAAVLRQYLAGRLRTEPLFPGQWHTRAAEMVLIDLQAAGLPYVDEYGEVYDFHSLRAQYITDLVRAGNNPADVQQLARHSRLDLTMSTYTKVRLVDKHAAVGKLPPLNPPADAAGQDRKLA